MMASDVRELDEHQRDDERCGVQHAVAADEEALALHFRCHRKSAAYQPDGGFRSGSIGFSARNRIFTPVISRNAPNRIATHGY